MGQCFPLPDDENLQREMGKHAHNHQFIFDQYNFDVETRPGSDMEKAERLWRRKQARHPFIRSPRFLCGGHFLADSRGSTWIWGPYTLSGEAVHDVLRYPYLGI